MTMDNIEEKLTAPTDDRIGEPVDTAPHQSDDAGDDGAESPLSLAEMLAYLDRVPDWTATAGRVLERSFSLSDFDQSIQFIIKVGELIGDAGHYPEIHIQRGSRVTIHLWTQTVNQLTTGDFIMAGRIDRIWQEMTAGR